MSCSPLERLVKHPVWVAEAVREHRKEEAG